MSTEPRKKPGVSKEYGNENIIVTWEPRLCIHSANCLRNLPVTFDVNARPWIDVDAARADDIAAAVMTCPSGALQFTRKDGGPQEEPPEQATVRLEPNGPMHVRGHLHIEGPRREWVREMPRATLCRRGASKNKPFCDNSHRDINWKST